MDINTPATNATTEKLNPSVSPDTLPSPSEIGIDEFDQVIGMKLSDLIREGCKTTEKAQGWGNMKDTACALTAAAKTLNEKGYGISS